MLVVTNDIEFIELLKGCRKQDRVSQNALYSMYFRYGLGICSRYVSNRDETILILNDGFFKVFKSIKKYDSNRDFKPWFKTIVVNTAINHIRKMKKFKNEINLEEAKNLSVANELLSKINYQDLLRMIHSLSLAYRTVFNMYVIDGFKHEEIANKLGIQISTSKSNLTRAKVKLRAMITHQIDI